MNAIGVDVSKDDFTISVLTGDGEYLYTGKKFSISNSGLTKFLALIRSLEGKTIVCMEYTSHYFEPIVLFLYTNGIPTYLVNPIVIHRYTDTSIRNSMKKTDKLDARKIASFIYSWHMTMPLFTQTDSIRVQLKIMNREFNSLEKSKTAQKNHTTALLDHTFPRMKTLFTEEARADGHQQWVDFGITFWHADCVTKYTPDEFQTVYRDWCKEHDYSYNQKKAEKIYATAKEAYPSMPANDITQDLILSNLEEILALSIRTEEKRAKMIGIAKTLPEFPAVRRLDGVNDNGAAQLIAEIGDVQRFANIDNMVAFSGLDPKDRQSGTHSAKSVRISKRGSPLLRKKLYEIVAMLYLHWRSHGRMKGPVAAFVAKKTNERKKYRVVIIAGCNKFMRTYYGTVKKYLSDLDSGMSPLPLEPEVQAEPEKSSGTRKQNSEDQTERRKRGRPCKHPLEEQAYAEQKKRGRPRKNTEAPTQEEAHDKKEKPLTGGSDNTQDKDSDK